jgi:hypothetical protein
MIHVKGMTQPQGHSTSGSHERYKSPERLQWEKDHDCILKFGQWIVDRGIATQEELDAVTQEAKKASREGKKEAWNIFQSLPKQLRNEALSLLKGIQQKGEKGIFTTNLIQELEAQQDLDVAMSLRAVRKAVRMVNGDSAIDTAPLKAWLAAATVEQERRYSSHLYNPNDEEKLLEFVAPELENAEEVDARIVIRDNFDALFTKHPQAMVFGEDSGKIGDVNQGLEGMQAKYGRDPCF